MQYVQCNISSQLKFLHASGKKGEPFLAVAMAFPAYASSAEDPGPYPDPQNPKPRKHPLPTAPKRKLSVPDE